MSEGTKIDPGDVFPEAYAQDSQRESRRPTLAELEVASIRDSIRRNGGNLSKVARELGVARSTLYNKIKTYGI